MSYSHFPLTLEQTCDEAIAWVEGQAGRAGLQVVRTFDLQAADHLLGDCPCPHHNGKQCDCRMVVLLVYAEKSAPISLVAHGWAGKTSFSIVDTPLQPADPNLESAIRRVLIWQADSAANQE